MFIIFSFSGCGNNEVIKDNETSILTIPELLEKYKRADFDEFLKDSTKFVNDYISCHLYDYTVAEKEENFDYLNDWEKYTYTKDDVLYNYFTNEYKLECVLFNKSAEVICRYSDKPLDLFSSSDETDKKTITAVFQISFDTGDLETDYYIARSLSEASFNIFGDAEEIKMNNEIVSESYLRKTFEKKDISDFHIEFGEFTIWFICSKTSKGEVIIHSAEIF